MNDESTKPAGLKQKIVHEMIEYWIIFGYLAFFLVAFIWYRRLILAEYHILYTDYWFPLIEAGVLAKVIMVGDFLGLGRALKPKPLFLRALYQTLIFTVWVALFSLLEKTARGLFHGKGLTEGFEEMVGRGPIRIPGLVYRRIYGLRPLLWVHSENWSKRWVRRNSGPCFGGISNAARLWRP